MLFTIYDPDDPRNIVPLDMIPSADRSSIAGRIIYWDNHYHFLQGTANYIHSHHTRTVPNNYSIVFHKTIQNPGQKTHVNCYFRINQDIRNIEDINCLQSKNDKMKNKFPIGSMDFELIREIIQRPFRGSSSNRGGKRSTRKQLRLRRRTKKQTKF